MKLIIIDENISGAREFVIDNKHILYALVALAVLVLALLASLAVGAYKSQQIEDYQVQLEQMRQQNLFDQHQVNSLKTYSQAVFLEQAKQVGLLEAKITRLEALGGQIADIAGMSDEFDFYSAPSIGGVESVANENIQEMSVEYNLLASMQALELRLSQREQELLAVDDLVQNNTINKELYLAGRPIGKGWLSSPFGKRVDPFTGRMAWHKGVDFAGKENADVLATASGVVTWSGERYGYGLLVEVNHGNGYSTRYAHNKTNLVTIGDVVSKGQALAKMGSTGRSTGPHVHYEVLKNGKQVDPRRYIYRKSI